MTSFDTDLVRGWFLRIGDRGDPVMPHWGIVPTQQELVAVRAGQSMVASALGAEDSSFQDDSREATDALTEVPARMVLRYLEALASGVAGTRRAFEQSRGEDDVDQGEIAAGLPFVDTGAMALVAGLNAGAAALHGEITSPAHRQGLQWGAMEPTAAESARQAGVAAAELVVNGAGLHEIAAAAAGVAMNGWQIGLPDDPVDRIEYRARGLVGLLLVALELQSRDPEPPAQPADCGALPGENLGRAFSAEITFSMGLAASEIRSLTDDLAEIQAEVVVWPGGPWPRFHLHTDRPGEAVGLLYAYGTPFDLEITDRG